ncbi:putative radical SAM superfamily [Burkholderia phage FLC6]|nr:putative radical SAM superfamily [Burkholderia phage FLC6]
MNNDILNEMLSSKVQDSTEIEHHLFEYCNLNCSFCGQDHDSKVGMESIIDKAHKTVDFIFHSKKKKHTINVMGGEIFNDKIETNVFLDYYKFYEIIEKVCRDLGVEFQINWVTNLIFTENREMVQWLMNKTKAHARISTSYDFAGRGLDINRSLVFKHNLNLFKEHIGVVGFVLTKPAIRKLLNSTDMFFQTVLYPNFPLYFDWYVPEKSSNKMMPSEQEMLDALLFVADKYPNIEPVKSMLENEHNKMTCFSLNKTTILPDGKEVTCRYLEYDKEKFNNDIDYSSNANIIQAHLDRNECYSCNFYDRCQFRCFVQADWAELERLPTCFIKTFFERTVGS